MWGGSSPAAEIRELAQKVDITSKLLKIADDFEKDRAEYIRIDELRARSLLDVASSCSVYSRSANKWFDGYIAKIFVNEQTNQEWMVLKYGHNKSKRMQRFCRDLRVRMDTNHSIQHLELKTDNDRISAPRHDGIIKSLRDENESLNEILEKQKKQIKQLKEQIEEEQENVDKVEKEKRKLKTALSAKDGEITILKHKVDLAEQVQELSSGTESDQIKQLKQQNTDLNEKCMKEELQIKELKDKISNLEEDIESEKQHIIELKVLIDQERASTENAVKLKQIEKEEKTRLKQEIADGHNLEKKNLVLQKKNNVVTYNIDQVNLDPVDLHGAEILSDLINAEREIEAVNTMENKLREIEAVNLALQQNNDDNYGGHDDGSDVCGHFWRLCIEGNVEEVVKYYQQFAKSIDLNRATKNGQTVLHKVAEQGHAKMIDWLLSLKSTQFHTKDNEGRTPVDIAKQHGHWNVVSKLTFAGMSDKIREKSEAQIAKLNRMEGMIKQWFRFYRVDDTESNEYKSMVKMTESLKTLIENRLPLSDDILMLCFHFELKQNNNDPLKCSIWNTLYNTLDKCLRIPLNRRNWLWFKQYIFESSIWYEKVSLIHDDDDDDDEKEESNKEKLLYNSLIKLVAKQLQSQRDYLKPYIDKLENNGYDDDNDDHDDDKEDEKEDKNWNDLKNYPEFIATDNPEGLRQDGCTEKGTGKELLPYPIRPIFNDDQLRKLDENVKEFNCHHHYDVHGYLSILVLIAHSLNDTFHRTMRNVFDIDLEFNSNHKDGVIYSEGPVKRLARSQAKAETDYASCSYPTTAKIIDFIRCCLIYDKPANLLKGIEKFMNAVNKKYDYVLCKCGEKLEKTTYDKVFTVEYGTLYDETTHRMLFHAPSEEYFCENCIEYKSAKDGFVYHCPAGKKKPHQYGFGYNMCQKCAELRLNPPLKKVLRVKNMFLDNKRENGGNWDLYKYADIKMGVLMEYEGQSMIVEVQFLLDFMLKAKGLGHGLYEIERNKDFIFDVNEIMRLGKGDGVETLLRNAAVTNNENQLATLILNHSPLNLNKLDENTKSSLLHIACDNGSKKVIKFILDTAKADGTSVDLRTIINQKGGTEDLSPLHFCIDREHPDSLRALLKYEELDINASHEEKGNAISWVTGSRRTGRVDQMYRMLRNDRRTRTREAWSARDDHENNLFMHSCRNGQDLNFVTTLWQSGLYEINDVNNSGVTALMKAVINGDDESFEELIKYLLAIPDIDINLETKKQFTAIDYAISHQDFKSVQLLYDDARLNWKAGRNKFVVAVGTGNLEMIQLVLRLWPEIDINAPDGREQMNAVQLVVAYPMNPAFTLEIFEFLLSIPGISADLADARGYTPWLYAVENRDLEFCKILWKRKDIDFYRKVKDKKRKKSKNAMDLAKQREDTVKIEWLKSIGFA